TPVLSSPVPTRRRPPRSPLLPYTTLFRSADTYFSRLRYLGQLDLTYLVCEGDGELVLIDQHAAHERVAFERLVAGHGQRAAPRRSEEHTSELQSREKLVCRRLLEKKKTPI